MYRHLLMLLYSLAFSLGIAFSASATPLTDAVDAYNTTVSGLPSLWNSFQDDQNVAYDDFKSMIDSLAYYVIEDDIDDALAYWDDYVVARDDLALSSVMLDYSFFTVFVTTLEDAAEKLNFVIVLDELSETEVAYVDGNPHFSLPATPFVFWKDKGERPFDEFMEFEFPHLSVGDPASYSSYESESLEDFIVFTGDIKDWIDLGEWYNKHKDAGTDMNASLAGDYDLLCLYCETRVQMYADLLHELDYTEDMIENFCTWYGPNGANWCGESNMSDQKKAFAMRDGAIDRVRVSQSLSRRAWIDMNRLRTPTWTALPAMSAGSTAAHSSENLFSLRAVPLASGIYYFCHMVSYESGTLAAFCSPTPGYSHGNSTVVRLAVEDDVLKPVFSAPKTIKSFPQQLLEDNRVLTRRRDYEREKSPDSRSDIILELLDTSSGEVEDITPANLDETPKWPWITGPPCLWTQRFGLAYFIPDRESREVQVWQGKESLEDVQHTQPILALGRGFINGRFVHAVVTDAGELLAYNHEIGRMTESIRHRALGREIARVIGSPQERPVRFIFAEEVAVFKWDSYEVYALVAADGSRQDLQRHHALDERPDGTKRSDEESDALVIDSSPLRSEGEHLPPHVVNGGSVLVPVNETHVGIFDTFYQRLIVIGPPEEKSD